MASVSMCRTSLHVLYFYSWTSSLIMRSLHVNFSYCETVVLVQLQVSAKEQTVATACSHSKLMVLLNLVI